MQSILCPIFYEVFLLIQVALRKNYPTINNFGIDVKCNKIQGQKPLCCSLRRKHFKNIGHNNENI